MGKKFGIWIIEILIALTLTACGKNETQALVKNSAVLQTWYGVVTEEGAEINSHQGYVEQLVEAHESNIDYGLAYGITAVLCEELELCEVTDVYTNEELAVYFSDEEQMYLLDFTLPMFETYFFDEDAVVYVQAAAVSFAEYMNEHGKLDKLYQISLSDADEDATKLIEMKNEWLDAIGVEEDYVPFEELSFAHNNTKLPEEYPYVMSDTEANWYFYPDDVKEYGYKAFIEEYLATRELMVLDFPEARELLEKFLPEEVEKVDICTKFYEKSGAEGGIYSTLENHIELYYTWETARSSLLHEYVHYLSMGETRMVLASGALAEGIAEEAAVWGCENRMRADALSSMYDAEEMRQVGVYDEEKERISYERMTYSLANSWYAGELDGMEYLSMSYDSKVRFGKAKTLSELSYQEIASLTHYLIELYGRDVVYENFYEYDSFMELIGKEFIEFYDEWGAWNKEQCDRLGLEFVYE